jgi:hypothetical protein
MQNHCGTTHLDRDRMVIGICYNTQSWIAGKPDDTLWRINPINLTFTP